MSLPRRVLAVSAILFLLNGLISPILAAPNDRAPVSPVPAAAPVTDGIGTPLFPNDIVVFDAAYTGSQGAASTTGGAILNLAVRNGGAGAESILASATVGSGAVYYDASNRPGDDELAVSPAGLIYYLNARTAAGGSYVDVMSLNPLNGVRLVVSSGSDGSRGQIVTGANSICYDYSTASLLIAVTSANPGIYRVDIATGARTLVLLNSTTANGVTVLAPQYLATDPFGNIFYLDRGANGSPLTFIAEIPVLSDSSASYGPRRYVSSNSLGAQNSAPYNVLKHLQVDNTQAVTLSGGLPANEYLIFSDEGVDRSTSDIYRVPVATGDHVRLINSATSTGSIFDLPGGSQIDTTGRIYYPEYHNYADGSTSDNNTGNVIPAGTKANAILSAVQNLGFGGDSACFRIVPPPAPALAAGTTSNLAGTTVTLNGNVTADGGVPNAGIFQRGFVYAQTSLNSTPRIGGGTSVTQVSTLSLTALPAAQGQNLGAFTANITGLSPGVSYTFSAYARDVSGITYTPPVAFTTATFPTVTAPTASNVTGVSATLGGNVTSNGGATLTARGIVYSVTANNNNPILGATGVTNLPDPSAATGVFTDSTGNNLATGTAYSYKAYATNSAGTAYTAVATFTTAARPTANSQSVTTSFNTAKAVTLTGSDPNVPAQTLIYTVLTTPAHGTLSGTAPNLTYTPASNYQGADSFQFTVTNNPGNLTSNSATVSITVIPGTPTATSQTVSTAFNTAKAITLSATDPDSPALSLTYTVLTAPAHGTLSGTAPNLTYTPTANYSGSDSFTFRASNGANNSNTATVSINVGAGAPTATPQSVSVPFNTARAITLAGSDPNVPAQTLIYTVLTAPAHGTLSGTAPNLTYTPASNYQGTDSFRFMVRNNPGNQTSASATISITVTAGTPSAASQSVTTAANTARAITLSGTDPDSPALALTYTVTAAPAHGVLSGTAPNLTYTPESNFAGSDSFTFTANNGTNTSNPAIVSITVTGLAPAITSANSATFNVGTIGTFTVTATGALPPALSATGSLPSGVTFVGHSDGTASLSGNPAGTSNRSYPITITAHNATSPDATQNFTLVINRPPIPGPVKVGAQQNTATAIAVSTLLNAATDPDGDALTVLSVSAASAQGGAASLSAPGTGGTITYTSAAAFTGADSITYTLSDPRGGIATGVINVTVTSGPPVKAVSVTRTSTAVTIAYAGIPGNRYQPQFIDSLGSGSWTNSGPVLTADGSGNFTYVDAAQPQPAQRFYRAITLP